METNEHLLMRLRRADANEAWREFYEAYRGVVMGYAYRCGLWGHAAEEVLQETFVALVRILQTFCYDRRKGRFRHFLFRIVHHRARAAKKRERVYARRGATLDEEHCADLLADDVPRRQHEAEWMHARREWQSALAAEALRLVRSSPAMKPRTFAIFEDSVVRGLPAETVAAKHGITVGNVHQIRHRTLQRIKRELAPLLLAAGELPA